MTTAFDVASISDHWGAWMNLLVDFALKGTAIILAAGLLVASLRRASAATRHLVLSLSLVSLLAFPVVYAVLPEWHASILPAFMVEHPGKQPSIPNMSAPLQEDYGEPQPPTQVAASGEAARGADSSPLQVDQYSSAAIAKVGAAELGDGADERTSLNWSAIAVVIWFLGFSLVLMRLLVGAISVLRIRRRAEPLTDFLWTDLAERISTALGLDQSVEFLESERVAMPLTCGALRAAVLVPTDTALWSVDRRRVVLMHELAHVKRRDCLTQVLANLVCAVYWFNPFVWLAARQLRIERERACDDYVLESGTRPSDYAGHLLELARTLGDSGCSTFAAVAIARRSQLEERVLAILDPHLSRRTNRLKSLFIGIAVASVAIPLGAMRLTARASESTPLFEPTELTSPAATSNLPFVGEPAKIHSHESIPAVQGAKAVGEPAETQSSLDAQQSPQNPEAQANPVAPEPQPDPNPNPQQGGERGRAIEALREALKDVDGQVRKNAMNALAHIRDKSTIEVMKGALKDQDSQIRAQAAWALGLNGDASSVDLLVEAIRDENGNVRAQAAWALGLKGDSRAVEPLIGALRDQEDQVRSQAAWALGLKGDHRAVAALSAALKDASANVRSQAAWALGLKGDQSAVASLGAALKDASANVRSQAAWALGLKGDESVVDALIDALKDENAGVRSQAAWALGLKGDRRAMSALQAAMKDDDRRVRQQAAWAFGMMLIRYGAKDDDR